MIKLFRDNNKFRLVNTEKVFINNKNELIFISNNIKFSFLCILVINFNL